MESKLHKYYPRWEDGVTAIRAYLNNNSKDRTTILVEQNRNLGDTLHLTPIIRHYRNQYPDAVIAFLVADQYRNAHEYNPHIDRLFTIPKLEPTHRISIRRQLITFNEINHVVAPSIFPYGAVWKELNWSHANIADQYFHNAKIPDRNPIGGRKLVVQVSDADVAFAKEFFKKHNVNPKRACVLEYNSYSARPKWSYPQFQEFARILKSAGVVCISMAGAKEQVIKGTINATGTTWRQSVAILNEVSTFIGSGSGITMLAAAADNPPRIWEVGIPASVSMEGCKYASSIPVSGADPVPAAKSVIQFVNSLK